jgi:hypothetical protein
LADGFRFAQPILHPHNDDIQRPETAVAEGELPASADIDGLSRFYLGVFQGMAIQARDGATKAELRGVVEAATAAWPGG